MYKKTFFFISIILFFHSCVSEKKISKPVTPALLINKIHIAFVADTKDELRNLMVDKNELINTLTEENYELVYAYDADLFTMATDKEAYKAYKKRLLNSYQSIKKQSINWKETSIQKAMYQTDSLQISITGFLLLKDDKKKIDSIHFKAVRLMDIWALTEIY